MRASMPRSGPGRPSGALEVERYPPRPKRASWGLLATLAGALMLASLASPAWADSTIIPDPTITPGAVRTTDASAICSTSTRTLRHWDRARDDRIMAEYGLPSGPHPAWELDHLVPLGIGGADDDRNLWPEPRRSIEPTYNAEAKDRLEWKLHDLICSGQIDVHEAQRSIAEDWTETYRTYFGEPPIETIARPLASPSVGALPRWRSALEQLRRRW